MLGEWGGAVVWCSLCGEDYETKPDQLFHGNCFGRGEQLQQSKSFDENGCSTYNYWKIRFAMMWETIGLCCTTGDPRKPDPVVVRAHIKDHGDGLKRCACWDCCEARRLGITPAVSRFGWLEVD
jgi:hypothetical protein